MGCLNSNTCSGGLEMTLERNWEQGEFILLKQRNYVLRSSARWKTPLSVRTPFFASLDMRDANACPSPCGAPPFLVLVHGGIGAGPDVAPHFTPDPCAYRSPQSHQAAPTGSTGTIASLVPETSSPGQEEHCQMQDGWRGCFGELRDPAWARMDVIADDESNSSVRVGSGWVGSL